MSSSSTPLLTALRGYGTEEVGAALPFQSLLTFLGCLMPVAVCLYLTDIEPLFQIGDVEFTQPDLVLVVIVLLVLGRAIFRGFHSLPRVFVIPVSLFLLSTIVSGVNASDSLRAAAAVIQLLEFCSLAWCFMLVTSPKYFLRIIHAIFAVFIFETLVAISQFVAGDPLPRGTFAQHQEFAMYTSYAAAMAFALLANQDKASGRWFYGGAMFILLIGSLLGQERAPWVGFVFSGLAVAYYSGERRKRLLRGFAITLFAAIILVASVPQLREVTLYRLAEAGNDTEESNSLLSRLALWGVAYEFFVAHPILGVGPKNYTSLIPHYLSVGEMMGADRLDPHNVWIQTLAEQGIVGFITYVGLCVAILKLAIRGLRQQLPKKIHGLWAAALAYHIFWITMSYHYFAKGAGHIHFMIIGLMLGMTLGVKPNAPLSVAGSN
jgi:O-antigen ligase